MAAPISVPEHDLVGGISVTGPSYRVSLQQLTPGRTTCAMVAAEIEEEVRIRLGPGRETGAAARVSCRTSKGLRNG